jgi:flagellar basal body rod protein FlgB
VQPKTTPINEFNNDVSLDKETGEMIKNTALHKTYMLLLKKKYQQMDLAMRFQ